MPYGMTGERSYANPKRNVSFRGAGRKGLGRDLGTEKTARSGASPRKSKVALQVVKGW